MTENHTRADDSFLRKIITGLFIALMIETGGGLYYYGKLVDRVEVLERQAVSFVSLDNTITKIDKTVSLISLKVDNINTSVDKAARIIRKVESEQSRRSSTIFDSSEHIKDKSIHGHK